MKLRIKNFKLNFEALTIKAKETNDADTRRVEGYVRNQNHYQQSNPSKSLDTDMKTGL